MLKDATVAIEDERFYKHKGVDYEGIVRAAIKNLRSGKRCRAARRSRCSSCATLYTDGPERDLRAQDPEAKLAQELENEHSKDWILTNYLNSVPYGTVGGQHGGRRRRPRRACSSTSPPAS